MLFLGATGPQSPTSCGGWLTPFAQPSAMSFSIRISSVLASALARGNRLCCGSPRINYRHYPLRGAAAIEHISTRSRIAPITKPTALEDRGAFTATLERSGSVDPELTTRNTGRPRWTAINTFADAPEI